MIASELIELLQTIPADTVILRAVRDDEDNLRLYPLGAELAPAYYAEYGEGRFFAGGLLGSSGCVILGRDAMKGYHRITQKEFYQQGGFSNSRLVRTERSGKWTYWKSND